MQKAFESILSWSDRERIEREVKELAEKMIADRVEQIIGRRILRTEIDMSLKRHGVV